MQQELILNTGIFENSQDTLHEVIYNRLDLPHYNNGKTFRYDAEEFRNVLSLFKDVPLVFAKTHPKNIGKMPIEDALKEVDGKLIGTPQDVFVNNTGTLFRGSVNVTDPEVNELVNKGKALLSTAFLATPDKTGVLRDLIPNHILVYPLESGSNFIPPGDHAALFLNQSEKNGLSDNMVEENKNDTMEYAKELIQNQTLISNQTAKISEMGEMIFNQKTEIADLKTSVAQKETLLAQKDELITNQAGDIEALKGKVVELSQTLEDIKTTEKTKRRERIFNQYAPGIKKQFDSRKEEIFDDSKYEDLIFEMNQAQVGLKQPPTEESGTETITNQGEEVTAGVSVVKDPASGKLVAKVISRGA